MVEGNAFRRDVGHEAKSPARPPCGFSAMRASAGLAYVPAQRADARRVLLHDASGQRWRTVGVSDNIIDASFQALMDSVVYKLMKNRELAGHIAAE